MTDREKIKAAKAYVKRIAEYEIKIRIIRQNQCWDNSQPRELQRKIDIAADERQKIINNILAIRGDYSNVIYMRYAERKPIRQICFRLGYSDRTYHRLHSGGLLEIYNRFLASESELK